MKIKLFLKGKSFYCLTPPTQPPRSYAIMELKQQPRQQLGKRHLKSEFALPQTSNFLVLNSEGLYQSSGKEKESCCLVFPSSTKQEIRHFHVVVVQRWLKNVQNSVTHMQSYCFANLNLILFCCSYCRRRRRCLSLLL